MGLLQAQAVSAWNGGGESRSWLAQASRARMSSPCICMALLE